MTAAANRYFAISCFWIQDEHHLALVKLGADQIARFQFLRRQLILLRAADAGVIQIVVDAQPVIWLPWVEELQERSTEEISEGEWEAISASRPEDYEDPETAYVHVTEHGLHFSCETEDDEAHTETILWTTLEAT